MSQTQWREPIEFAAGDTLAFVRKLASYPASQGWSLLYVLRGQAQPIEFSSVADGDAHSVTVAAAATMLWLPGDYILAGYAVNGDERHQIYEGDFKLLQNLPATPGDVPQQTFAQQMLAKIEAVMLGTADDSLLESRIGETLFRYLTPQQLRTEHGYWSLVRKNEIQMQRARVGLPTGNKRRPRMQIIGAGVSFGGAYPFPQT